MKTIGIIGGMGPLATADLFQKIIMLTDAGCDNDHIHIVIDNNTEIPDRTDCILHGGRSPVKYLVQSAVKLQCMGADALVMPCNTAHYFYDEITKFIDIPLISMIEETAKEVARLSGPDSKTGLLGTEGTCRAGVYDKVFQKYHLDLLKPSEADQKYVTELIYGIKAGREDLNTADILRVMDHLRQQGAKTFILGCTELPVAFQTLSIGGSYIDPTRVLARAAVRFAGAKYKEE